MRRISAGQRVTTTAASVEKFVDSLKDLVSAMQHDTPRSKDLEIAAQAIEAIEKDEGFSPEDIKNAALVIVDDPPFASAYLSITNKGARTALLRRCMKQLEKDN